MVPALLLDNIWLKLFKNITSVFDITPLAKSSMNTINYTNARVYQWGILLLRISAIILLLYAIAFLIMPDLLGHLVGFTHHSPNTLVEVTAFYGGLELGIAIYLLWSTKTVKRTRHALILVFIAFFATGLARFLGIIRFGFEGPSQPIVCALEISWSVVAYWLSNKIRNGG